MKIFISLLMLLGTFVSFSQDWQTYFSDAKTEIQFAVIDHETPSHNRNHQRIVFKYINKTSELLTINFDRPISYDGEELLNSPERNFTITLEPNSESSFDAEINISKLFYIFSKDHNNVIKRKLTSFDITNLIYQ